MTKYRVWDKYNEEKEDAIEIDAWDAEDAAIEWGKLKDGQNYFDYNYDGTVVYVLDKNKKRSIYTIYAVPVPEFHAYEGEEP